MRDVLNSLSYDAENRLIEVDGGATARYVYDAGGRRVRKTVSGILTDYFYSGSVVISEKQGSTWTDYIFFGNQRIARQTGSTASTATYLHTEHLGSTRVCTNSSGDSVGTCSYEPFGEVQPGSTCGIPTNYRFAGMEFDSETGLYHTWFRQYDPSQGRWMSVDPLPGTEDNPQSQNRYVYVLDDPINLIDLFGLDATCEVGPDGIFRCRTEVTAIADPIFQDVFPCTSFYVNGFYVGNTCHSTVQRVQRDRGGRGGRRGPGDAQPSTAERVACAAQFGQEHSLAGLLGRNIPRVKRKMLHGPPAPL